MKARSQELLDKSISAMLSAIEIYNKPNFEYRAETFAILAINSWELLFKSKWLLNNNNKISSLYVYENKNNKNGCKSKKKTIKLTRSNNPFTSSINYIACCLIEKGQLNKTVWLSVESLIELRDCAIHFYNYSNKFNLRIQELGSASLRNYVLVLKEWFNKDLTRYNLYLMPLAFSTIENAAELIVLNTEEKNFFKYVESLEESNKENSTDYALSLNIDFNFTKSKTDSAIHVALSNDPSAVLIKLTEEQVREKYPYGHSELVKKCNERYYNFKANKQFYIIKKSCEKNKKYAFNRLLDTQNPKSPHKFFYNSNIFKILDKYYGKRG